MKRLQHLAALICACITLTVWSGSQALADGLGDPAGEIVLTVSGDIKVTNTDGAVAFDMAMLEELGATTFETTTIWTEGVQTFVGVELQDLVKALGVDSGTLRASAVNDYAVEIPVSDAVESGPIIAFRRNGAEMSLREKGPLWIVYPFDNRPEYQSELIYSRSIWQLDRIEVLP
ncbi:MAG: oxidoreductase [Sulfitobacter sp.]